MIKIKFFVGDEAESSVWTMVLQKVADAEANKKTIKVD